MNLDGVYVEKTLLDLGSSRNFISLEHVEYKAAIQPTTKMLQTGDETCQRLCRRLVNGCITIGGCKFKQDLLVMEIMDGDDSPLILVMEITMN